jgi:hypothetical protein
MFFYCLSSLLQEHQVKDGTALEFLLDVLSTLKKEKGGQVLVSVIKKSGLESRLMEFFPSINQQQTEENLAKTFMARDLPEVVTFRKSQASQGLKNDLQRTVQDAIEEEKPVKDIILEVKEGMAKSAIQEQNAVVMVRGNELDVIIPLPL